MIVELPLHWRGRAVLHGLRTSRDNLFRETVPISVPEFPFADALEVCRREAHWAGAKGTTISTLFHQDRFWRPVWRMSTIVSAADLPDEFGRGELLRDWSTADTRYVTYGPKVANERQPLPPEAPVKRWDSDDRESRVADAVRFVASRCTLFDGVVYEESPEPVIHAAPDEAGSDLDAHLPDGGARVVYCDNGKHVFHDFVGSHVRATAADCFRLDRMEAAVEHAAARWNLDPDDVERIRGFEILRPDLLSYDDENLAAAGAAADAYRRLSMAIFLLPRAAADAVLDLRDARQAEPLEDRIGLIHRALSAFEEIDPSAVAPALVPEVPKVIARLRAGLLRHEMFVAQVPDLLAPTAAP